MTTTHCPGTQSRRAFLRTSLAGLGSLGLADLFRLEAARPAHSRRSMIVLWLWGGPSHMETFDLKPDAPAEFRGEFRPIPTNVPGIQISEHLPRLTRLADRFAIIRSLHHGSTGHVNSTHTLMSAYPGEFAEAPPFRPKHPDLWAVTRKMLGQRVPGVPTHVAMPNLRYNGSAYLGSGLEPFTVSGDPSNPGFSPGNLVLPVDQHPRLSGRLDLVRRHEAVRRQFDGLSGTLALDRYTQQAADLLTSKATARAFDLASEPTAVRERYGMDSVGQRCLLARRLVEAGVRLVTIDFPCVPGQKAFSWDDHASVWNIFEQMKIRLPVLDRVVSALIEDLCVRGLDRDTLLVVMGEMSHTPRLSNFKGQPGREHWGQSMSVFLAGGMPMGQVVGSTNSRGEEPRHRPVSANDLLATWYTWLGVPADTLLTDSTGRPVPIVPEGKPIRELVG